MNDCCSIEAFFVDPAVFKATVVWRLLQFKTRGEKSPEKKWEAEIWECWLSVPLMPSKNMIPFRYKIGCEEPTKSICVNKITLAKPWRALPSHWSRTIFAMVRSNLRQRNPYLKLKWKTPPLEIVLSGSRFLHRIISKFIGHIWSQKLIFY